MPEKDHQHHGHRMRMKNRYLAEGLDHFEPHEILELLLYYAIPRRDVNGIAHRLLEEYGSIANVFDADVSSLKEAEGIGENAAILLNLIPSIARLYHISKWDRNVVLSTMEEAGRFATTLFFGKNNEEFAIILLDSNRKVHYAGTVLKGTVNETAAYPRLIVNEVLKHNGQNVILTHNHPNGSVRPSEPDIQTTKALISTLEGIGISVLDHIIVAGDRYFSMSEMGLIS